MNGGTNDMFSKTASVNNMKSFNNAVGDFDTRSKGGSYNRVTNPYQYDNKT